MVTIDQSFNPENGIIFDIAGLWLRKTNIRNGTTMTYIWYEAYKTAVLETEWTTMPARLQAAEDAIHERQRVLSMDHGGTLEERQAIAAALSGIGSLKTETAGWQDRNVSGGERTESWSD